jgi:hypothetical protein
MAAARTVPDCDFVVAQWHLRRPDETILDIPTEPISEHVDTNCFFMLPGSYHVIHHFGIMPRQLSPICDRIFYAAVRTAKLTFAVVPHKTVNYHCLWSSLYAAIGEKPPAGAKPNIDMAPVDQWLLAQTPRQLEIASRRAGVRFAMPEGHPTAG